MRYAFLLAICLAGFSVLGKAVAQDGSGGFPFFWGGGGPQSYQAAPAQSSWPFWSAPATRQARRIVRAPRRPVVHLRIVRPKAIAHADIPHSKGPVSIYTDRTLRRGDSVMTAQGLRVFRGSDRFPYRPSDFVALSQASSFVVGDKKQLRAIQLAFERIEVPATQVASLATGRSVSVASAAAPTDAAGKKIRYVGP